MTIDSVDQFVKCEKELDELRAENMSLRVQLESRHHELAHLVSQLEVLEKEVSHSKSRQPFPFVEHCAQLMRDLYFTLDSGGRRRKYEKAMIADSELFDPEWYLAMYVDVRVMGVNPISHYVERGCLEGRDPCENFSTTAYLDRYPDVAAEKINPLIHFILHGRSEGRLPK